MELFGSWVKAHKKALIIFCAAFGGLMIALMAVFSVFDLQVTEAVHNDKSVFGIIFFILGYLPAILVDTVLFSVCFAKTKKKIGLKILFAFLVASTIIGMAYSVFSGLKESGVADAPSYVKFPVIFAVGGALTPLCLWLFKRLSAEVLDKLLYIFIIGAIMALLCFLLSFTFQYTWGRPRYKDILAAGDVSGLYRPWYSPSGPSSANTSFFSMHASSTCSMVMLVLAAWKFRFSKVLTWVCAAIAAVVLFCVAFSRVVMGWHFMTDTIFAVIVAFGVFALAVFVADKIYIKKGLANR